MNERPTFNQVNDQDVLLKGTEETVLVKRKDGRILVGRINKETKQNDKPWVVSTGEEDWAKPVPLSELSDQRQVELAEELAGKPLGDSEVLQNPELQRVGEEIGEQAVASEVERPHSGGTDNLEEARAYVKLLEDNYQKMRARHTDEENTTLWKYSSEMTRADRAKSEGHSQAVLNDAVGRASEIYNSMSPELKKEADLAVSLMREMSLAREQAQGVIEK